MGTKILAIGSHAPHLLPQGQTARASGMYVAGSERAIVGLIDDSPTRRYGPKTVATCAEVAEESVVFLAKQAVRDCLYRARVEPDEIGLIIYVSPILEHILGDATRIQDAVAATRAAAYQIKGTAYAGAMMGLVQAVTLPQGKAVVVCVDYLSSEVVGDSSVTGDLATAMLFSRCGEDRGLLACYHHSPPDLCQVFPIEYGVRDGQGYYREKHWARTPLVKPEGTLAMEEAINQYGLETTEKTLKKAGMVWSDVRWFIPLNFGEVAGTWREVLKIPPERYLGTWAEARQGVVSSIPWIMMEAMEEGRFSSGDKILWYGADSGNNLVSALWKW